MITGLESERNIQEPESDGMRNADEQDMNGPGLRILGSSRAVG